MIQFFMPMASPPVTTAQQHKVAVVGGKPRFYDPPSVTLARAKLRAGLAPHRLAVPLNGPLRLTAKWCWPSGKNHTSGTYKHTRPDIDNLQKLLQDEMTRLGFWADDGLLASVIAEKFWSDTPGIFIRIERLT